MGTVQRRAWPQCLERAGAERIFAGTALGIGGVGVGTFDDAWIQRLMAMAEGGHLLYLMMLGRAVG